MSTKHDVVIVGGGPAGSTAAIAPDAQAFIAPGCVSIAFAQEKWAEREAAFNQQIEQLRALVQPVVMDAASEASPSEAADLDLADPLDDSAWSKVDRTKRHKLLHREKDVLAKNVRSKLSKVSTVSSPFQKV